MDRYKKFKVFISWRRCVKDKQAYQEKECGADQHYVRVILHAFKKGCVKSINEQDELNANCAKQAILFKRNRRLANLDQVFQAWRTIHDRNIMFQRRMDKISKLRSLHICRIVYSSWARHTYKHEKYRKKNQIAAIFYLKNLYQKVFVKGLKWNYELKSKSRQFERKKFMKVASE
jgi:hypothetical protein